MLKRIFGIINKVEDQDGISTAMLPFQLNYSHEIRTPTVNEHARIVETG